MKVSPLQCPPAPNENPRTTTDVMSYSREFHCMHVCQSWDRKNSIYRRSHVHSKYLRVSVCKTGTRTSDVARGLDIRRTAPMTFPSERWTSNSGRRNSDRHLDPRGRRRAPAVTSQWRHRHVTAAAAAGNNLCLLYCRSTESPSCWFSLLEVSSCPCPCLPRGSVAWYRGGRAVDLRSIIGHGFRLTTTVMTQGKSFRHTCLWNHDRKVKTVVPNSKRA